MVVLSFEFHQNRLSGFGAVGGRNLLIPIDLAIGLYNSLYYRTSRDYVYYAIRQHRQHYRHDESDFTGLLTIKYFGDFVEYGSK